MEFVVFMFLVGGIVTILVLFAGLKTGKLKWFLWSILHVFLLVINLFLLAELAAFAQFMLFTALTVIWLLVIIAYSNGGQTLDEEYSMSAVKQFLVGMTISVITLIFATEILSIRIPIVLNENVDYVQKANLIGQYLFENKITLVLLALFLLVSIVGVTEIAKKCVREGG